MTTDISLAWPDDALLTVDDVVEQSVTLSWQRLENNEAIVRYRVYQDHLEIASTDEDTLTYQVTDLEPWTTYTFRIEAEDSSGRQSNTGPQQTIKTEDLTPPGWPNESTVIVSRLTPSGCQLGWTHAVDNVAVSAYQILQDSVEIETTQSAVTWVEINDLSPAQTYQFVIYALDEAGNPSEYPLTVSVVTPDEVAPVWDADSELIASEVSVDGVTLAWSAATDDVAVTQYRLFQDNIEMGSFDSETRSTRIEDLDPNTSYTYRVEAEDASGNLSYGGPSLMVDLSDRAPPMWTDEVMFMATDVWPTRVRFFWSPASDNLGVSAYHIMDNDQILVTTPSDVTTVTVRDLSPMTDYVFSVAASDEAGNLMINPNVLTITTPDHPQLIWPESARLNATSVTATTATLSWSDIGANALTYSLFQDDVSIATISADNRTFTIEALEPQTDYRFRIEAIGVGGQSSTNGPTHQVTTPALTAPSWSGEARLTASEITETSLTLSWTAFHDLEEVSHYHVYQDGALRQRVDVSDTTLDIEGLSAGEQLTFSVEAEGTEGDVSGNGPRVSVTMADVTSPTWPNEAALSIDAVSSSSVTISWPHAHDNARVNSYDVVVDGVSLAIIPSTTTTYEITALMADTQYTVHVHALDAAGNRSGELQIEITTSPEPLAMDQDVFDALQPLCAGCHNATVRGEDWFTSLEDFQQNFVQNTTLITPGEPNGSLLIQYLEGNGPGSRQMPPFGQSYSQLSLAGETHLSIEEIRLWIERM